MKVIDFEKKGNLFRLFLGADDCDDYWGDDWDDAPYEHNAGTVYDEYVQGIVYAVMAWAGGVSEPSDDWHYNGNSPFSKENFRYGNAPCLLLIPPKEMEYWWGEEEYTKFVGNKNVVKVYYNQPWDDAFRAELEEAGCVILGVTDGSEEKWTENE